MGRRGATLAAALGCFALAACGGGDTGSDTAMAGDTTAAMGDTGMMAGAAPAGAMSDARIMARMGGSNGMEIATGEIAQEKATSAEVKQFARDMVTEHQGLQAQADSLAVRLNVTPQPADADSLTRALEDARSRLQGEPAGAGFDRMYMEMQVQAHESTLNLLNEASAATQNAELRTLIQNATPSVQQHLDRARQILNGLGAATD